MSVTTFTVTRSQILDWCQTGRLLGGTDARPGEYLIAGYGVRFGRPNHYVNVTFHGTLDAAMDVLDMYMYLAGLGNPSMVHEYELWQVVGDSLSLDTDDALEALRMLREAGDDYVMPNCAYCGSVTVPMVLCKSPVARYYVCERCYRTTVVHLDQVVC